MAAALGVGTMAGGIGSANIVLAEEQNEETEAADETSEEPADETDSDSSVMKIGALKGPTAMGMAQLLDDENYEFSLAASPDEIVPMIVQGPVSYTHLLFYKAVHGSSQGTYGDIQFGRNVGHFVPTKAYSFNNCLLYTSNAGRKLHHYYRCRTEQESFICKKGPGLYQCPLP